MNDTDKLFLETVNRIAEHNKQHPDDQQTLTVAKATLSKDMQHLMGLESNALGTWFMGVYVTFTPLFNQLPAKDWQKAV